MPPVFHFINPCFCLLTTYCSLVHSFDALACDPSRHTPPRITVFLTHDCMIYDIYDILILIWNVTPCSRTIMSEIRFYEIRCISLNKGDLVHRLGTRRSRCCRSYSLALRPKRQSGLYATASSDIQATRAKIICPSNSTLPVPDTNGLR